MAKGLRSKVKRRLRGCRRAHFMKVQGYKDLQDLNDRLNDPNNSIVENCKLKYSTFIILECIFVC